MGMKPLKPGYVLECKWHKWHLGLAAMLILRVNVNDVFGRLSHERLEATLNYEVTTLTTLRDLATCSDTKFSLFLGGAQGTEFECHGVHSFHSSQRVLDDFRGPKICNKNAATDF